MLNCDTYLMPESLGEALRMWSEAPDGSRLIAGATDILPWAREGRAGDVHIPTFVDVTRVAELQGYEIKDGRVRLGANVVYQDFLTDPELGRHLPCMPFCSIWFADDQIREQATLAGNVVNASPAADGTPPVLAMNGTVELARLEGWQTVRRELKLEDFLLGPGKTALQPNEIVTAVTCDSMLGYGGAFEKVGQRRSLVISVVCTAALVKLDRKGERFEDVRMTMGGIGPVPVRLEALEQSLTGQPATPDTIVRAAGSVGDIVNSRSRREYRGTVVKGFIERALENAVQDAQARATNLREVTHA
ncbi:MAG: FAD binding domain-containing protein [Pseudomonadota bacterium]